ncbi:MAG: hypothetical protein F6K22_37075 [Okeania sp. SIO2F4]|uniref:hypothetical protein n=1 Tax=Okeania sp. SIO2F4 TaxID=2607790 RepID=UPI00142B1066|nr:hypothetical protein [Okeania sp. SIO2F4]NES07912.1 hypothetical protein [Okeania sp. SIO2F4]
MVVDVESKQVDAQKLSQDISLLREKLEEFSHVESNPSQFQEKVTKLSSQILELQKEKSNIGVGLEPLFRRVKSLENSLQNLSGQIEEKINSTLDSQQQVYEIFLKFAEDTKLEIKTIVQKLVDIEYKQVDVHKLSQYISLLSQKLERFSHVESNSLELEEKVAELSAQILYLQQERSNIGVGLEPLFHRVKSLENSLQNMEVKSSQLQEKVKNNLNLSQEWKEFFYISIWSLGLAIIPSIVNLSMDNPNIFLSLLCLVLASPFLLTSLVIFFWSYFSIVLMFGRLLFSSPHLVLSKVDYWLSRYRFICGSMVLIAEKMIRTEPGGQKLQALELRERARSVASFFLILFIISLIPFLGVRGYLIQNEYINCSENKAGWILCFLNAAQKQPELMFAILLFLPSITVSWFVIYWLILQLIKALALLKQKFLER